MRTGPFATILRQMRSLALSEDAARQEDARLLDRFVAQHDEAAFEALLRRHGPMVLGVCRRLLPDPCDAEDAFQATFLVLLRQARSLGRRERVGPWLYGVARRTALHARRSAVRRQVHEKQASRPPFTEDSSDLTWRDLRPVLDDELDRLPEKYRAPVVLCYLEGKTFNEAADLLGWPAGTVAGRLARAREILRRRLTRRGVALTAGLLGVALAEKTAAAVPPPLLVATIQTATALVAGHFPAVAAVSPSAAALMEGVLQAMFLKQLKTTLTVTLSLILLVVAAGVLTHTTLAARQADDKKEEKKADKPAPAAEDKLTALLKERVEAAKTWEKARHEQFLAGRGTLDILFEASKRLLEAERELSDKKADQIAALEAYFKLMKEIEEVNQARYDAGRVGIDDLAQSKYYRLEAEIWLERAKAK
jgi:RNA polymerase sigma factor (sigma-70 family)